MSLSQERLWSTRREVARSIEARSKARDCVAPWQNETNKKKALFAMDGKGPRGGGTVGRARLAIETRSLFTIAIYSRQDATNRRHDRGGMASNDRRTAVRPVAVGGPLLGAG
jgi:hypothetical protein